MSSKMECLNLIPFCSENLAQDSPKTLQDDPKTPQDGPRTLPDFPKTPQDAPKTPPRRGKIDQKSVQETPRGISKASWKRLGSLLQPRSAQELPRTPSETSILKDFGKIFGRFGLDLLAFLLHQNTQPPLAQKRPRIAHSRQVGGTKP